VLRRTARAGLTAQYEEKTIELRSLKDEYDRLAKEAAQLQQRLTNTVGRTAATLSWADDGVQLILSEKQSTWSHSRAHSLVHLQEGELGALRSQRATLLQSARMEEIELPLVPDDTPKGAAAAAAKGRGRGRARRGAGRLLDDDDGDSADGEGEGEGAGGDGEDEARASIEDADGIRVSESRCSPPFSASSLPTPSPVRLLSVRAQTRTAISPHPGYFPCSPSLCICPHPTRPAPRVRVPLQALSRAARRRRPTSACASTFRASTRNSRRSGRPAPVALPSSFHFLASLGRDGLQQHRNAKWAPICFSMSFSPPLPRAFVRSIPLLTYLSSSFAHF